MKSIVSKKRAFVSGVKDAIETIVDEKTIYGVSIAPITLENKKEILCLGRERDGIFLDQFNYFGGKIEDKITLPFNLLSKKEKITAICEVLFEETCEEFGIVLTCELFLKCLLGVIKHPYKDGYSLVFVCHIDNVQTDLWRNIMLERRKDPYLPWNLQEMSEIKCLKIKELKHNNISSYVEDSLYLLTPFYKRVDESNLTKYEDFETTYNFHI